MKNPVLVSVLALTTFTVFERSAAARNYLHCVSRKVVIVDAPALVIIVLLDKLLAGPAASVCFVLGRRLLDDVVPFALTVIYDEVALETKCAAQPP